MYTIDKTVSAYKEAFVDSFMTISEVAAYMRCSIISVRRYAKERKPLPHYRIGGKLLFKKEEVDAYIAKRHVV